MMDVVFAEIVMGVHSLFRQGQAATSCFRSDGSPMVTPGSSMVSWGSIERARHHRGGSWCWPPLETLLLHSFVVTCDGP